MFQWLRDKADVGNSRLLHRVHNGCEGAERDVLIGPDEDELIAGIANFLAKLGRDFVDINCVVAEEDALVLVDGTSTTSTSGVMLMSASAVWVRPLEEVKAISASLRPPLAAACSR